MIKQTNLGNFALTLVLILSLSACGFHLRGNIPLPDGIKNMFVAAPAGSFKDQLELVLENGGAVIAANRGGADVVLKVTRAESSRSVGTLDERGKANSYDLEFEVKYRLLDPQGGEIREATLRESRRYNFDPELVIESESEEADLLIDMETDIALRVVRQLSSVTNYPATEETLESAVKEEETEHKEKTE